MDSVDISETSTIICESLSDPEHTSGKRKRKCWKKRRLRRKGAWKIREYLEEENYKLMEREIKKNR
jgi:hypothetical protein